MFDSVKNKSKKTKEEKVLSFIENNAPKDEFIGWLNTQYDVAFTDEDSWEDIKKELLNNHDIGASKLQMYAASLNNEQDIKKILQNVEEETERAKTIANKLFYLSKFKKFSISLGGIITLQGLLLIIFGVSLLFQILNFNLSSNLNLFYSIISVLLGIINLISGLLLSTS